MATDSHSNPVPAASGRDVIPTTQPGPLDANGFDPTEFEWRPVPRRPRKDGWTPEVQQRFIEALARTGVVERACEEVNMSSQSAYALRNARGGEGFARAWAAVLTRAADRVLDIAFEQAIEGEEVPIFDQDGVRTGAKRKYNTRMAMFLLKAYHPERFRHADKDTRRADEPPPPAAVPVAEVIESLAPVTPAEPHLLTPPDQLKPQMLSARAQGERLAATPAEQPEPYKRPSASRQERRVFARALRNRARRARQQEREEERYGTNEPQRQDEVEEESPIWPPHHSDWLKLQGKDQASTSPQLPPRR